MCYLDNENLMLKRKKEERKKKWNLKNKAHFWNESPDATFRVSYI